MQSILKMCNIHSFHSYPFNVQVNITQLRTNKEKIKTLCSFTSVGIILESLVT